MTVAIDIKNLGKKYKIGTQSDGVGGYKSLRDGITEGVKGLFKPRKNELLLPESASEFWAVRDVNLSVNQGERVGIVGHNGAGKSTLLKLISRITHPTTGEIQFNGRITSLLEVGTGFHPELTGRENIFLNGAILGMPHAQIRRKFDEIVDFAGIEKFLDTPVKRYSSGMYTRLAFSVAANLESEILIIDEVLAVGDAQFQKKCLGKMEEVGQKEGRTVLFVSHNMSAVSAFCNRIVWLDKGQKIEDSYEVRPIITRYLQSDTSQASHWKAENSNTHGMDTPYCRPIEFYIGDKDGNPLDIPIIENNQETYVYFKFEIDQMDSALEMGYSLFTDAGELMYWSFHSDRDESKWPNFHPGVNFIRSKIPSRMLNEGSYRLEWIANLRYIKMLIHPGKNAPGIQLTIQGGVSDSPLAIMKRPGLLAPILEWSNCG